MQELVDALRAVEGIKSPVLMLVEDVLAVRVV